MAKTELKIELPDKIPAKGSGQWFVVVAKNGRVFHAQKELRQFYAHIFVEKFYRRHAGRRHKVEKPLLGRYFLLHIRNDEALDKALAAIRGCAEVDTIVPHGRPSISAEEGAVYELLASDAAGDFDKTSVARGLEPGDRVRLTQGAFKGALGTLTEKRLHERWTLVLDKLFGAGGKMEAKEAELEAVLPGEEAPVAAA